ncbi:MAG TPA: hypothetical protein VHQ45_16235 [Gemmatimonadaceae bacterium]|nr:hypothetical protein [Gemmatimonadaceae bacterium]
MTAWTGPAVGAPTIVRDTVSVIDVEAERVVAIMLLDARPATSPSRPMAAARTRPARWGGSEAQVDVREYRVIARALVGTGEEKLVGVVVSPDGRRAYTANGLTNDVSVVELSALQVSSTIRVGTRSWGVAVVR